MLGCNRRPERPDVVRCLRLADLQARRAAHPGTVYHLYSGTKLFTATAILRLRERGLLQLETPAAAYLPDIALPPALVAERALTLLLAPIARVTGYDTVIPLPRLEQHYMPSTARIAAAARRVCQFA